MDKTFACRWPLKTVITGTSDKVVYAHLCVYVCARMCACVCMCRHGDVKVLVHGHWRIPRHDVGLQDSCFWALHIVLFQFLVFELQRGLCNVTINVCDHLGLLIYLLSTAPSIYQEYFSIKSIRSKLKTMKLMSWHTSHTHAHTHTHTHTHS